jgi:hypothetical protein
LKIHPVLSPKFRTLYKTPLLLDELPSLVYCLQWFHKCFCANRNNGQILSSIRKLVSGCFFAAEKYTTGLRSFKVIVDLYKPRQTPRTTVNSSQSKRHQTSKIFSLQTQAAFGQ